ncbi:MAG: hypothetical protein EAZ97_08985 [Bacteroidetes bacterium]|nr:MAG: hypothetical protein EAZ97_08985 [Bacteroidota bacterium]
MKLINVVLLSSAVSFLAMGMHQLFLHGILASYWLFMLVFALLMVYRYKTKNEVKTEPAKKVVQNDSKPKSSKRKK